MQSVLQPFKSSATAGIAIVGAGLIAVTPTAAPPLDLSDVQSRAVQLTAGDAWDAVFNTASENLTQLTQNYGLAPFVGLQQAIVNQGNFFDQVVSDPSSIPDVVNQMQENAKAALSSFTLLNADDSTVDATILHTLNTQLDIGGVISGSGLITAGHNLILAQIGSFLPEGTDLSQVTPIVDFLASPASAMLIGFLGPFISPWVALANSISDGGSFSDDLASFVGGFLNGADLNLDSLIPAIESAGLLPEGTTINGIDLALGGLLSTGGGNFGAGNTSEDNTYTLFDSNGDVSHSVDPVGGSLFNALGLNITIPEVLGIQGPFTVDIPSGAIGPIGALEEFAQVVGVLLGSGWDGADASADAPLVGFDTDMPF